jgi:hypothetical protein
MSTTRSWRKQQGLDINKVISILCYFMIVIYLGQAVYLIGGLWSKQGLFYSTGNPAGADFLQIWTASSLARHGNPAMIFDYHQFKAAEEAIIRGSFTDYLPWHYPPSFLLLALPAALIPYLVSFSLWIFLTLAAVIMVLTRIAPHPLTPKIALAFPPTALNLLYGQGAFFIAALLGGGLLLLESHSIIAGLLFGLIINYKPHLGFLILVALASGRYWKALGAVALITLVLALASYAIFGREIWLAFFNDLTKSRLQLEGAGNLWDRMPTMFAGVRLLGGGLYAAWVSQIILMLSSVAAVLVVWRRASPLYLRASVLVVATLLFTPHAFEYDLLLLGLPLAWMAWEGLQNGWRKGDLLMLLLVWLSPSLDQLSVRWANLHLEPVILFSFMIFLLGRGGFLQSGRRGGIGPVLPDSH